MNPHSEIEVRNISKIYDHDLLRSSTRSLDKVSIKFPKGLCIGLMGHNGAGKTTTIRIILGLIKPTEGAILFRGHPITALDRHFIGYMPEADKIARNLSPFEILFYQLQLYSRESRKTIKHIVRSTLETVGLAGSEHKLAKHLSKGMRRRLSWAQATIHSPEIIILDEPYSGMDPLGRIQIRAWMKHQTQLGKTLILCTHELEAIFDYCDEFHIIRQGSLVYSSDNSQSPLDLSHQPHSLAANLSETQAKAILAEKSLPKWSDLEVCSQGTMLTFTNRTEAQDWIAVLSGANISINSLRPALASAHSNFSKLFRGDIET